MPGSHPLHVGIIAGEASGDNLGAALIHAIRKREPDAVFEGVAGPRMIDAGCFSLYPMENLSGQLIMKMEFLTWIVVMAMNCQWVYGSM